MEHNIAQTEPTVEGDLPQMAPPQFPAPGEEREGVPDEVADDAAVAQLPEPRHTIQLTPPPEFSFSKVSFTPFRNRDLKWGETVVHNFTWNIDAHVYPVNASVQDPNFTARGGRVYIVLVNRIPGSISGGWVRDRWCQYAISTPATDGAIVTNHQPNPTPFEQSGNSRRFPISYTQAFQLFTRGGHSSETFNAQYDDVAQIDRGTLSRATRAATSAEWEVRIWHPLRADPFSLNKIMVCRVNSLRQVTLNLVARAWVGNHMAEEARTSIVVDCRFRN
ncbi:hypothetical protein ONZ45_g6479 [Pleurotus djamor]|nr:hypothetical protein ONZ45_g6479 [Pleurotus djamor]